MLDLQSLTYVQTFNRQGMPVCGAFTAYFVEDRQQDNTISPSKIHEQRR
ncbi:MAG: hypothetical protein JWP81_917 [Ferruginibacter sp.]|nr:hypothetical protein [Ferruginibacter sp.]